MNQVTHFPAKLLLFGEHTVLNGSRALSLPLWHWSAQIGQGKAPDGDLQGFAEYLSTTEILSVEAQHRLHQDVANGLRIVSDIPQGYGVGSSGALCAAILQYYGDARRAGLEGQRHLLAKMEAYFHGSSSGMDPLVSYVKCPVLREGDTYHVVSEALDISALVIFVVDSGSARRGADAIAQFQAATRNTQFETACLRPLSRAVDHAISFCLEGQWALFWEHLTLVSALQYTYLDFLIPQGLMPMWQDGLDHGQYLLKLCGAGGGGYYLGFAKSQEVVQDLPGVVLLNSGYS